MGQTASGRWSGWRASVENGVGTSVGIGLTTVWVKRHQDVGRAIGQGQHGSIGRGSVGDRVVLLVGASVANGLSGE